MTQRNRVHDGARAAEKFYLPAGTDVSSLTDRVGRIWAALFNHGVHGPR